MTTFAFLILFCLSASGSPSCSEHFRPEPIPRCQTSAGYDDLKRNNLNNGPVFNFAPLPPHLQLQADVNRDAAGVLGEDAFWFVDKEKKIGKREVIQQPKCCAALPQRFDWRNSSSVQARLGVSNIQIVVPEPVKISIDCGACFIFAALGALESTAAVKFKHDVVSLSEMEVLACHDNSHFAKSLKTHYRSGNVSCDGGSIAGVFSAIASGPKKGRVSRECEYKWDCPSRSTADSFPCLNSGVSAVVLPKRAPFMNIESSVDVIKNAIWRHGPLAAAIVATEYLRTFTPTTTNSVVDPDDFDSIFGGSPADPSNFASRGCLTPAEVKKHNVALNHAVVIIGWGEEEGGYFIMQNNWGTYEPYIGAAGEHFNYSFECYLDHVLSPRVDFMASFAAPQKRQVDAEWIRSETSSFVDDTYALPLDDWYTSKNIPVQRTENGYGYLELQHIVDGDVETIFYNDLEFPEVFDEVLFDTFELVLSASIQSNSTLPSDLYIQLGLQTISGMKWTRTRHLLTTLPMPVFYCLQEVLPYNQRIEKVALKLTAATSVSLIVKRGRFGRSVQCSLPSRDQYFRAHAEESDLKGLSTATVMYITGLTIAALIVMAAFYFRFRQRKRRQSAPQRRHSGRYRSRSQSRAEASRRASGNHTRITRTVSRATLQQ